MHTIELLRPEVSGNRVTFRWLIDPEVSLYRRPDFSLEFDRCLNLSKVSERLWLDLMLLCLHQHWLLLRPCKVVLPAQITEDETAFWLALLKNASDTLHFTRGTDEAPPAALGIEISCSGPPLRHVPIAGSGVGAAFSSGKDSLLQAALLLELTERPLLVTTTSPLPPLEDHETERRREVFKAIRERRDPVFSEVLSDFRENWDNEFALRQGYRIAVNELTDTFLYMASLIAVGAMLDRTRLFLASEAEVQENVEHQGVVVQHLHFMYSAATQRAVSLYLSPHGIAFGSLLWPLYSMQVQQLLWDRYPDMSDLQYSCWRVTRDRKTCSHCEQCLRTAMTALAGGHDPERMGIELKQLMAYAPEWQPVSATAVPAWSPWAITSRRVRGLVAGSVKSVPVWRFAARLFGNDRSRLLSRGAWRAVARYRRLRVRLSGLPPPARIGVRQLFLEWLDVELKGRIEAIYRQHFEAEPIAEHRALFERSHALTERATSRLTGQADQPPANPCEA